MVTEFEPISLESPEVMSQLESQQEDDLRLPFKTAQTVEIVVDKLDAFSQTETDLSLEMSQQTLLIETLVKRLLVVDPQFTAKVTEVGGDPSGHSENDIGQDQVECDGMTPSFFGSTISQFTMAVSQLIPPKKKRASVGKVAETRRSSTRSSSNSERPRVASPVQNSAGPVEIPIFGPDTDFRLEEWTGIPEIDCMGPLVYWNTFMSRTHRSLMSSLRLQQRKALESCFVDYLNEKFGELAPQCSIAKTYEDPTDLVPALPERLEQEFQIYLANRIENGVLDMPKKQSESKRSSVASARRRSIVDDGEAITKRRKSKNSTKHYNDENGERMYGLLTRVYKDYSELSEDDRSQMKKSVGDYLRELLGDSYSGRVLQNDEGRLTFLIAEDERDGFCEWARSKLQELFHVVFQNETGPDLEMD